MVAESGGRVDSDGIGGMVVMVGVWRGGGIRLMLDGQLLWTAGLLCVPVGRERMIDSYI